MTHYLRLFGGIALEGPSGPLSGRVTQQRSLAVLALLALAHPHGCTRDKLVGYVWPESDQERARHRLADVIHIIRKSLGDGAIVTSGEMVRLGESVVACDVTAFLQALDAADLASAVGHYHGAFLDGFTLGGASEFERWMESQRQRLGDRYAAALQSLTATAAASGDHAAAVKWWKQLLSHDPYNSRFALGLIEALALSGDPANAWLTLQEHERLLRDDLDVEPPPDVRRRAEELVAARQTASDATSPPGPSRMAPSAARAEIYPFGESTSTLEVTPRDARSVPWRGAAVLGIAALFSLTGLILLGRRIGSRAPQPAAPRTSVVVLPFENLSPEGPYAYFAGGLHMELLTQLAKVAGIRPIGRASVLGYVGPDLPPLRQIASDLDVGSVVEGTVQVLDDRLRVNVQLIDAMTGEQLWGERYDRTLDDAFVVQSEIVQHIVQALGVTLRPSEWDALAAAPTANAEAYRLFLQGLDYRNRPDVHRENLEASQQLFEGALALDSTFALGHAFLSEMHGRLHWFGYDRRRSRYESQLRAAETALRLAPDLPQAHWAMAMVHYWGERDYAGALEELGIALQALPGSAHLWATMGYVHRRLGQWSQSESAIKTALLLSPRDPDVWSNWAQSLQVLRRYEEALEAARRSLALDPDRQYERLVIGRVYLARDAQLDTLHVALTEAVARGNEAERIRPDGYSLEYARLLLWEREADSLLAFLARINGVALSGQGSFVPVALFAGWAHQLRGDHARARLAFDSASALLDSMVQELPNDWRMHAARGLALAAMDLREDALSEARWIERAPVYRDHFSASPRAVAQILASAGEAPAALAEIERLLSGPSGLSVAMLRLDPLWDSIRDHPGFRALLKKYDQPVAALGTPQ